MPSAFDASWGLLALASWGIADYLARPNAERLGAYSTSLLVQAIGLVLPLAYLAAVLPGSGREIDWATLAYAAPLAALFLGTGYTIYYRGIHIGSVSIVSAVTSAWLLVSVVIAVLFLGESIGGRDAALIGVVMGGIALLSMQRTTRHGTSTGLSYAIVSMFTLGAAFALWKPLTEAGGPALAVVLVRGLSSMGLWAYMRLAHAPINLPVGGTAWRLLLSAAALDAFGYVAYNIGLDRAPLTLIAPLAAAHPVVTGALAWWLLRERPRRVQALGFAVTVAGVITLSAVAGA